MKNWRKKMQNSGYTLENFRTKLSPEQLEYFNHISDENGEIILSTNDFEDFAKLCNCFPLLIEKFSSLSNLNSDTTNQEIKIDQENELKAGVYSKYCARYYCNRNFALCLCFDYFYGYKLCLSIFSNSNTSNRGSILNSLGYNYITKPCWKNETWLNIILDDYLFSCDEKNVQNNLKSLIIELKNKFGL